MTRVVKQENIDEVVEAVFNNQVVAFPTETVFGVGVRFNSKQALDALMEAKNRDYSKPITLMLYDKKEIEKYAYINKDIEKIVDTFMPGMLTLVFKKKESVDSLMTNGKETIGIRIPDHQWVLSLLKKTGPMLVTSANLSQHQNTTTTKAVLEQLDGRIELVVDGKTNDTIASTVVDVSTGEIKILREGKITEKEIKDAINKF